MARRHHRHRSMGHRRGRPVSRSRFFSTAGPGTSNSRTTTFFKPIAGLRDFAVATRSTMVQFFERVSSWLRRQHDDIPNIIHLESRRPQPLNFQAFRNRFLKHIGRIDLPRNGPLAQLPPEIQLETFFYLDYQSLLNLQSSCRYYEYFISAQMLEDSKERTKELYMDMEHRSAFPINQKPCYTCLQIKGHTAFHDPSGNRTYPSANPGQLNTVIGTRYCIPCGVKEKKFKPGEQIIAGGHTQAICKHCKRLNTKPVSTWRAGWACPKCNAEVDLLLSTGPIVRLAQAAFAIIIFALACSGQAVPRSSHLTHGTWRWVFTISLVDHLVDDTCDPARLILDRISLRSEPA